MEAKSILGLSKLFLQYFRGLFWYISSTSFISAFVLTTFKTFFLKVLSQGEKRALYILNILFEVKVRKNNSRDCLFVIDDVLEMMVTFYKLSH
jgi:hypothetical protein